MIRSRSYFGVAAIGKYLYIIGGLNYLEGAMMKCERFNLETKQSEPINYLNSPSSHHSVCSFQDKYIYKFGGLKKDNNQKRAMVDSLFERYSVEKDVWQKIVLKDNSAFNLMPKVSFHGGIYDINENQLLVVGGQLEDNEMITQCFLFNVGESFEDNKQQSLCKYPVLTLDIKDMNTKLLPACMMFKEQSYQIYRRQLYLIGTSNLEDEKKICMFDGKTWKLNKA